MFKALKLFLLFILLFVGSFVVCSAVFAISGNTTGYAWSDQIGWVRFGCDNCDTQVTISAVTGYAWNNNVGWIKLDATSPDGTGGVKNNGNGVLSGYAWGDNTGWINFSGVAINTSTGGFAGTAAGDLRSNIVGAISFDCPTCNVQTDWRPSCGDGACNGTETCSTCPVDCGACPVPIGGGGGGGGVGGGGYINVITTSSSANGSISPSSSSYLNSGSSQTFTITPNTGYQIADVLVDGKSVGAVTAYTFNDITSNHTISATFSAVVSCSLGSACNQSVSTIAPPAIIFTRTLELGSSGTDVEALQSFLNNNGFPVETTGPGSLGNETTYFGPATQAAVAEFQTAHGITPAIGIFGPITQAAVEAIENAKNNNTNQNNQSLIAQLEAEIQSLMQQIAHLQAKQGVAQAWCYNFNSDLGYGSEGADVLALKTALTKEGFNVTGDVSGTYGNATSSAVSSFQKKYASDILIPNGLTQGTGYVGSSTRTKLNTLYGCAKYSK